MKNGLGTVSSLVKGSRTRLRKNFLRGKGETLNQIKQWSISHDPLISDLFNSRHCHYNLIVRLSFIIRFYRKIVSI